MIETHEKEMAKVVANKDVYTNIANSSWKKEDELRALGIVLKKCVSPFFSYLCNENNKNKKIMELTQSQISEILSNYKAVAPVL